MKKLEVERRTDNYKKLQRARISDFEKEKFD